MNAIVVPLKRGSKRSMETGKPIIPLSVTLVLTSPHLDPENITRLLNISPDISYKTGHRLNERMTAPSGKWCFHGPRGVVIETSIQTLIDRIVPIENKWQHVQKTPELSASIFIGLHLEHFNHVFQISPSILETLGRFNLRLDVDITSHG